MNMQYDVSNEDVRLFGEYWCGPEKLEYGNETIIAKIPGDPFCPDVTVYCTAYPAKFYRIVAEKYMGLDGVEESGFTVDVGSGMIELVVDMAKAISQSLLTVTI